jgi:transposase
MSASMREAGRRLTSLVRGDDDRKMLVEAAWSEKTAPGPLRAFFIRVQSKPGAAAAATARMTAVRIRGILSGDREYAFARRRLRR